MRYQEFAESQPCPECGGASFSDLMLAEKQDACYHKVKSRYKVWPSAYASGALVQCRKKGAANWGNKSKNESVEEARAATARFRTGNKKRAELNAMSDEERRAYDREQQEKQRRRDDARLEREREKNAAKKGVAEGLNEFSFNGDDDDTPKDDPYKYPKPEHYRRSIDFFGKFEANHFDKEDMDDATGVFKGYWYYGNKLKQIAYFKFDNPQRTGSNDPGMGWYYEPQDEDVAENSLNEFAPGGNSASSYYAVTSNFVSEFSQQKEEEIQDLIAAGWTKQDLEQAGTLQGQAADIAHFEQVRDGFLKGLKPGFDAYLQGDTQMKDQLGEYWLDNDLPLNQDWEKIYGEPWGDDGMDEGVAEANPNQQLALYKPDSKTYRGQPVPGPDTVDPDDITARRRRADSFSHRDVDKSQTAPDPEQKAHQDQLKRMFDRMLQDLPPRMKQFVYLRYHHDMTLDQVAQRLGIATETARQIEAKMLRKLKGKHGDELRKAAGAPEPAPTAVQISNKDAYAQGQSDARRGVKYNTEKLLPRDKESYRLGYLAGYKK